MLRLTTLGGLRLSRGEETLTGAATQRRRLAILAVLAVAGERGMSRDQLQALLWPDADAARARHVLNQLVYAQRQHFEEDQLFLGKKTLRLNPAVLWTDLGAFDAALEAGALEELAGYYQGPFLEGFHLGDSPEFERWADTQRERLARRYREALSSRAAQLDQKGDVREAVQWWRRVAELDPLDSRAMGKLIVALAKSGDRVGALRQARAHQELLRIELALEPDAEFRRVVEGLTG